MDFYFKVSIGLLLASLFFYFYSKEKIKNNKKLLFSIGFFVSVLLYIIYYAANSFTGDGLNSSVFYTMSYGLDGAGFSEYGGFIIKLVCLLIFSGLFSLYLFFRKSKTKNNNREYIKVATMLLVMSLAINPLCIDLYKTIYSKIKHNLSGQNLDFYKIYKNPEITQTGKPKNLVFIYAEGLERTYFDESIFPGLITNLKKIEENSISFTNIDQAKYSGFTMGGLVASQCGLPLVSTNQRNSMSEMDTYLENATCLGDLLKEKGYYNSFIGGASSGFGGKGKFFESHGFQQVLGKDELLPKLTDKNYLNGWGLHDDSLFNFDYEKFIELSESGKKFALFTLTLDTHHPNGMPSGSCEKIKYKDGSNKMLNAVACSDYIVSNFVNKIRQSKYSDNTVIVIASDHIAMENGAIDLLKTGNRKNLFLINLPGNEKLGKIDNPGTNFDISSTILPFIGYKSAMGFGNDVETRKELGYKSEDLENNSGELKSFMEQFWNFPKIKNSIKIFPDKKEVYIDDRLFKMPIFIEMNNKLETNLFFQPPVRKIIKQESGSFKLDKDESYILIDKCSVSNNFSIENIDYQGYCLLTGKRNKTFKYSKIDADKIFTSEDIYKIAHIPN